MAESLVYERLNAEVAALEGRIYPLVLPQEVEYPAVVYLRVDATRYPAFGRYAKPVEPTIRVDVYGHRRAGYQAFLLVADAVLAALERYSGTSGTLEVLDTYIDAERDDYIEGTDSFLKSFDIRPWYQRN